MSIDIDWETLTTGEDGARMAESIRHFVHEKFQQVPLPRFLRSIQVKSFDFGDVVPELEVKDVCDPLPDFYDDGSEGMDMEDAFERTQNVPRSYTNERDAGSGSMKRPERPSAEFSSSQRNSLLMNDNPLSPRLLGAQSAIPGGVSNMNYFHLPIGPGFSGATTPLAAVAGAGFQPTWPGREEDPPELSRHHGHHHSASINSITPPSSLDPASRPSSQHHHEGSYASSSDPGPILRGATPSGSREAIDRSPNDLQVVAHVKYAGNIKMGLTAEIILDYPTQHFVGIPLQLNVTGIKFDGVAILAYIKKKAHFCFLSPEDADTFIGAEETAEHDASTLTPQSRQLGDLLEEINVESEIGQREDGKQVLKNVGRVERFILEQVRRIFEDEFVYPSFWTFLV